MSKCDGRSECDNIGDNEFQFSLIFDSLEKALVFHKG